MVNGKRKSVTRRADSKLEAQKLEIDLKVKYNMEFLVKNLYNFDNKVAYSCLKELIPIIKKDY